MSVEDILVVLVLILVALVAVFVYIFHWGGPSTSRRSRSAGMLIVAVSSLSLACLRYGRLSCGRCILRHQCHRTVWVPAAEEIAGRPVGTVGNRGVLPFPGEDLERIRRFLETVARLVDRLNVLLTSLPIRLREISSVAREVWQVARLLSTFAAGQARP